MIVKTEIHQYGYDSPLQVLKYYEIEASTAPRDSEPLVSIHAGFWMNTNNTYMDFDKLITEIDLKVNNGNGLYCPKNNLDQGYILQFYSIGYRRSPEVKHPEHLKDILRALKYINEDLNTGVASLVGHSAGATIIT
ncbi:unnamed protein product [Ambrosiozyma monospora]|uniref:Unnamed protein product n=1 Tax=Ambrosiozyma monospora TaxID=43982 RepID=A0ACB5UBQ7_AMBMO|nr:unnamed protein product [Ambrosiozyma monospora]